MKRVSKLVLAAALLAFAFGATRAMAFTGETVTLPVQASVTSGCLLAATGINFGAISPLLVEEDLSYEPYDGEGSIDLACGTNGPTLGSFISVGLDNGANGAIAPILGIGTDATAIRAMTNGTDFLAYDLFLPTVTGKGTSNQSFTCLGQGHIEWTNGAAGNDSNSPASAGSFELIGGGTFGSELTGLPDYQDCVGANIPTPGGAQAAVCVLPICASISGDQVQPLGAGVYTDTVTATVTF
jgi:spore coat protein U-like protein